MKTFKVFLYLLYNSFLSFFVGKILYVSEHDNPFKKLIANYWNKFVRNAIEEYDGFQSTLSYVAGFDICDYCDDVVIPWKKHGRCDEALLLEAWDEYEEEEYQGYDELNDVWDEDDDDDWDVDFNDEDYHALFRRPPDE